MPVAQAPVFHQDNQSRSCRGVLRCLWVPVGFAHGILTLCDSAEVLYKASGFWSKTCERALHWADPSLAIAWPLAAGDVFT